MITFYSRDGARWSCVRNNHSHYEGGQLVPCMACHLEALPVRRRDLDDDKRGDTPGGATGSR